MLISSDLCFDVSARYDGELPEFEDDPPDACPGNPNPFI
jgi:hypothetical protein